MDEPIFRVQLEHGELRETLRAAPARGTEAAEAGTEAAEEAGKDADAAGAEAAAGSFITPPRTLMDILESVLALFPRHFIFLGRCSRPLRSFPTS